MTGGLKVRLDDGSEVGPLELAMVRSWYEQGLINSDSAVQRAGSKSWTKLAQAVDLRAWGNLAIPSKKAVRSRAQAKPGARARTEDAPRTGHGGLPALAEHWGTSLSGVLLLAAAAGVGYFHLQPQDAVPPLDRAPFWPIALGLLAAALALLPGWDLSRKVVRLLAIVVAVAAFPLLGILFAQGVRGAALYASLGIFVFFMAVFAFLAEPAPHWARASLGLLAVAGGAYVTGRFAYSPETDAQRQIREAVTAERRFGDPSLGVTLDLPEGWLVLKKDAAAFPVPPEARVAFAHPRQQAFGYLETASSPPASPPSTAGSTRSSLA